MCFEDEPGKQVRSAIKIKNTSKSHVSEEQVMRVVFLDPENPNPVSLSFFLPVLVAVKCDIIGIMLHFSPFSKGDGETEESTS